MRDVYGDHKYQSDKNMGETQGLLDGSQVMNESSNGVASGELAVEDRRSHVGTLCPLVCGGERVGYIWEGRYPFCMAVG